MTNHPITPPPELRRQWLDNDHFPMVTGTHDLLSITRDRLNSVIDQATQWGADQELEACCEWLAYEGHEHEHLALRAARRPNPPSLTDPTDEEIMELMPQQMRDDLAAAASALAGFDRAPAKAAGAMRIILNRHAVDHARAALAKWGTLPPQPVWADIHYAWELEDAEGEWQAGGSANSLEDVQREGNRYLQTYSQDGPHKLIIQRHCVTTIEEATND